MHLPSYGPKQAYYSKTTVHKEMLVLVATKPQNQGRDADMSEVEIKVAGL